MVIETSAPTRIDLAGGTLDIWPLYLFHDDAQTINVAISLRASAHVEPREDGRVVIRSLDTGREAETATWSTLRHVPELRLLGLITHWFLTRAERGHAPDRSANGVTLTTSCESPAGAGIAGSSALNVAVCAALAELIGRHIEPEALLEIAMNIEAQAIDVPTGLQDYRPAMYGGVAALELGVDGVRRTPLSIDVQDLQQRLVLCYTGEPRNSGINNWEITKRHIDGDQTIFECFERIRDAAGSMREALVRGDWEGVGRALDSEWLTRTRLAPGVTTPAIDALVARGRAAGATAAKVCGAGGGGCLVCYGPPSRHTEIAEALAAGGARVLPFHIDVHGLTRG